MKTLKVLLSSLFFFFLFSVSYGQPWLWGAGGYGAVQVGVNENGPVATDKKGNVYVTATSQANSLTIGSYVLHNTIDEAYIVKYNSSGKVVWATNITGGSSTGNSIATDASGNVYITGDFGDTVKIGAFTLISPLGNDVFLAKFDSNGNALWAKQSQALTGTSSALPFSLATDNSNNIFLAGTFGDTVYFGSFTLNTHYNSTNYNNSDVFLVKYDQNGNVLWAQQSEIHSIHTTGAYLGSVATDKLGNAYIVGYVTDTLSFASFSLADSSLFLVKYSPTGTVLWATQSTGGPCAGYSVITDGTNSYTTGAFEETVKFGSHAVYSSSETSTFLAKYDSNGKAIWAKQSSEKSQGTGVASDSYNHIYLTGNNPGQNSDSFKFNGYTIDSNPKSPYSPAYILKLDTAGNVLCGSLLYNLNVGTYACLASDYTGTYIYTASTFNNSIICGPDTVKAKPGPGSNAFIGRWLPCDANLGVASIAPQNASVILYPNPSDGQFTIAIGHPELVSGSQTIEVYNVLGAKVFTSTLPPLPKGSIRTSGGGASFTFTYQINLSSQPNGIYLYRVITEEGSLIGDGKLVIAR